MATELSEIAARLEIDLGSEPTKERLLTAINTELRDLQLPQTTEAQQERQVSLVAARGELTGKGSNHVDPSKDLVPLSLISQVVAAIQAGAVNEPMGTAQRPDPTLTMRTNVKAAATQASADFSKARSWPFSAAGALLVSAYGLRTYFNVGDLQLPSELFYLFLGLAALAIVLGFSLSTWSQRLATLALRRLYDPDVQEEALNRLSEESQDFFGSHSEREFVGRERHGISLRAVDDGGGIIINRPMYRDALQGTAHGGRSALVYLLSTVDLEAAADDAAGLALDRLSDLKILEPVVYQRRQAFRLVPEQAPKLM